MKSMSCQKAAASAYMFLLWFWAGLSNAQDNLLLMSTTVPLEADAWYQGHYGDSTMPHFEFRFARVHAEPNVHSAILGSLSTVARWETYLHFAWVYQPVDLDRQIVWREDVGDWGYGIHQFVVDTVGGWVELPPGPYGANGWVRLLRYGETDGFAGEVNSIDGRLVTLDTVEAEEIESGERRTVSGTMMVESIIAGQVRFRPEVPTDMPCDLEERSLRDPEVPHYRASVSALVTEDLQPKFVLAYPKGC